MSIEIDLIAKVKHVLKQNHAQRILIAVSGGVDSMVLTDVISKIYAKSDFAVVNVDHDLRPESKNEVKFVADYCRDKGFDFYTTKWNKNFGDLGMEAAARKFRYGYFEKIMNDHQFDTLLTAHHANDLAENILMKLIRSGNVYEITSLKSRRSFGGGQLLRPLLSFSKSELKTYAKKNKLDHIQDETNFENITMRNRLRNNIFPQLETENGQLLKHFGLFDRQLNALIDISIGKFLEIERNMDLKESNSGLSGNLSRVDKLDVDQQTLFWGSLFTRKLPEVSVSNKQIIQLIEVVLSEKPNTTVDLENNWKFIRSYSEFEVKQVFETKQTELKVELNKRYKFNNHWFELIETDESDATFSVERMPKQIILRTRRSGDKLTIKDLKHQKLGKRFINEKIPEIKRDNFPILLFDNEVVWVEKIYNISDYLKTGKIFFKIQFDEV
ncbi:tRNA lysidine(34) synthetase TilS [Companilactobacillus mishanensis]|uniref:tRNA(Ile)-lysidine synthase n=1 Tax=Companilactobacillus mishanensis TaxID=2486008 RepID=A0ABW9P6N5_9LACO|nr:tRNA lysidine(34) synthetase TilS [Companilactobacillus mishanensis]MQS44931.1 tRNA lysidine(34) synthetase TilS [Companilactobacillus mishanensis]